MSPEYISKYIKIMDDHIKLSLLAWLRSSGPFTFFIDEISDVTKTKQTATYATIISTTKGLLKNIMWEPSYKQVSWNWAEAPNIMKALIKFFDEINVPIIQVRFSYMDNTSVNSSSCGGLKIYILH